MFAADVAAILTYNEENMQYNLKILNEELIKISIKIDITQTIISGGSKVHKRTFKRHKRK